MRKESFALKLTMKGGEREHSEMICPLEIHFWAEPECLFKASHTPA